MKRFKNILVGVDLSSGDLLVTNDLPPPTQEAVDRALWLAQQNGAALTFFHSLDVSPRTQQLIAEAPEMPRPYLVLARVELARGQDLPEVERLARAGLERAESAELKALGYFLLADTYSRQGRRAELEAAVAKGNHYRDRIGG